MASPDHKRRWAENNPGAAAIPSRPPLKKRFTSNINISVASSSSSSASAPSSSTTSPITANGGGSGPILLLLQLMSKLPIHRHPFLQQVHSQRILKKSL
ncbi:unnamed protein product [Absidia cylindrospora]